MLGNRLIAWLEERQKLAPFQRRFCRGAFRPGIDKAVLCAPRGAGKSSLSGELLAAALDPTGPLHVPGAENILLASSLDQARAVFRFLRARCPAEEGFRYVDSGQRVAVKHLASGARVRVASSDAKRAFGFVGARLIVGDEPGAWQERGGALMYDALETSGGKNETLLILIGTRAPGSPTGWWLRLVASGGADEATYVQVHAAPVDEDGEVKNWSKWSTVRRANPLVDFNPHLGPKLRSERKKARYDDDARRRFITYRLNRPQADLSTHLVTPDHWLRVLGRPAPPRDGRAILGIDIGSTRSWSAATLLWRNGRAECYAVVPGIPALSELERRDSLPRGTFQHLVAAGSVAVAEGKHVADVEVLLGLLPDVPLEGVIADRFHLGLLQDALAARCVYEVEWVTNQWSDASIAVAHFRAAAMDGDLAIAGGRTLATLSLSMAEIESDTSGNSRLRKAHPKKRDDVAQSLVLAVSAAARWPAPAPFAVASL